MRMQNDIEKKRLPGWADILRFALWVAAAILTMLYFATACSPRIIEHTTIQYRDTTIYKEVTKDTTIYVPLPLERDQVIVHLGDTSHLSTSMAESWAFVGGDGLLHHSLENSRKPLPVVVPVRSVYVYSGVSQNKAEIITKYVEVEKPLSWWQSLKIGAFWWLLAGLALCLAYIFRKPLSAFIKTLLKIV